MIPPVAQPTSRAVVLNGPKKSALAGESVRASMAGLRVKLKICWLRQSKAQAIVATISTSQW